jgi:Staphylococcal nuclease homologue
VLVRLANIDAPESIQSGGGAATRALHNRILGQPVSLKVVDRDRDQLLVAVVFLGNENINAWMVKQGHAWAYRGFNQEADYCVWENAARSLRRGLWRTSIGWRRGIGACPNATACFSSRTTAMPPRPAAFVRAVRLRASMSECQPRADRLCAGRLQTT